MKFSPFTIEEAAEICEDFEDMVDTEFKIGSSPTLLVAAVAIAPADEAGKNSFLEHYSKTKNSEKALGFYTGNDYDVVLITYPIEDETNYSYICIRTFSELRGIKYSFPE